MSCFSIVEPLPFDPIEEFAFPVGQDGGGAVRFADRSGVKCGGDAVLLFGGIEQPLDFRAAFQIGVNPVDRLAETLVGRGRLARRGVFPERQPHHGVPQVVEQLAEPDVVAFAQQENPAAEGALEVGGVGTAGQQLRKFGERRLEGFPGRRALAVELRHGDRVQRFERCCCQRNRLRHEIIEGETPGVVLQNPFDFPVVVEFRPTFHADAFGQALAECSGEEDSPQRRLKVLNLHAGRV